MRRIDCFLQVWRLKKVQVILFKAVLFLVLEYTLEADYSLLQVWRLTNYSLLQV